MALEFDYGQNLPLPKLAVTRQFYERLLWMNVFNIHCHVTNVSALYWFTENQAKKDPNSVCSFIYNIISRKSDTDRVKKMCLFSNSAGGQN